MGITGLLKQLAPISQKKHISDFNGKRAGIDGFAWLHRGLYACAYETVNNLKTTKHVDFFMSFIQFIIQHGIQPLVVFDGGAVSTKAGEEKRRRDLREENERKGRQFLEEGNRTEAHKYFQRALRVRRRMIVDVVKELKKQGIQFLIAPYEADSQLAYLFKTDKIDFVISEDSDLLVFGVRRALFKLDKNTGYGDYFEMDCVKSYKPTGKKKKNDFCLMVKKFRNDDDFIHCCVLSGCDYLDSLPMIGLVKSANYIKTWARLNFMFSELKRVVKNMKTGYYPKHYDLEFERATLAFKHQRVFDPDKQEIVHLNPLGERAQKYLESCQKLYDKYDEEAKTNDSDCIEILNSNVSSVQLSFDAKSIRQKFPLNLDFLGKEIGPEQARLIAECKWDPRKNEPIDLNVVHENEDSQTRILPASLRRKKTPPLARPVNPFGVVSREQSDRRKGFTPPRPLSQQFDDGKDLDTTDLMSNELSFESKFDDIEDIDEDDLDGSLSLSSYSSQSRVNRSMSDLSHSSCARRKSSRVVSPDTTQIMKGYTFQTDSSFTETSSQDRQKDAESMNVISKPKSRRQLRRKRYRREFEYPGSDSEKTSGVDENERSVNTTPFKSNPFPSQKMDSTLMTPKTSQFENLFISSKETNQRYSSIRPKKKRKLSQMCPTKPFLKKEETTPSKFGISSALTTNLTDDSDIEMTTTSATEQSDENVEILSQYSFSSQQSSAKTPSNGRQKPKPFVPPRLSSSTKRRSSDLKNKGSKSVSKTKSKTKAKGRGSADKSQRSILGFLNVN